MDPSPEDPLIRVLHGIIRQAVRVLAVLMVLVILWGTGDVLWVLYQRLMEPPRFVLNIVMDEPTNHLDLPSIECLEDALADCPCGLLLVSHDERFLRRLTSRRWCVEPQGADAVLRVVEGWGSRGPSELGG